MNTVKAVTDYLFSDLEKKHGYPYEKEILNVLKILGNKEIEKSKQNQKTGVSAFFENAAYEAAAELSNLLRNTAAGAAAEAGIKEHFFNKPDKKMKEKTVLNLLHPESGFFPDNREEGVAELRKRREIKISSANPSPLSHPAEELIFTSNFIITVPISDEMLGKSKLSDELKKEIKSIMGDKQKYWFDHPVPIGIARENNELIYGLKKLAETLSYEKSNSLCPESSRLTVIISVSVTHDRLKSILHRYMEEELKQASDFKDMDIYIFTEDDTDQILEKLIIPAAEKVGIKTDCSLKKVFGVDGEYGRHYSFLKAVTALWQILADSKKRGTFKIDLDQVFPEKELVRETGKSAFQHFMTPLWGAEGIDWKGRKVELGMIAGSLVNEKDIKKSLFEPDVLYPEKTPEGEERIFFKQYPMALSTEAEMDLRQYNSPEICQMRYHVTGGTNGILIDALRKHRPFTPTFIGRAEDQGYILSVLFSSRNPEFLRYLHQPGLKMRHDKEAFISDAIKSAKTGTYIGDLIRILAFSAYADIVEGDFDKVKEEADPFTGSFISRTPSALVLFKLLMHINDELAKDKPEQEKYKYLEQLISSAAERLSSAFSFFKNRKKLEEEFKAEKKGWELYYDILDIIEEMQERDIFFLEKLKKDSAEIFENCRL